MARYHILDSNERFRDGSDVTANCGAVVPRAVALYVLDHAVGVREVCPLQFCRECDETPVHWDTIRYTFVLGSGQEQMA